MNEREFKQACYNMTSTQLLPYLHVAEQAVKAVWYPGSRKQNLEGALSEATERLPLSSLSFKIKTVITAVFGIAGVLLYIYSSSNHGFLPSILKLVSYFLLMFPVFALITLPFAWKEVKSLKKRIPELEAELAKETSAFERAKEKHNDGLVIRAWIFPQECTRPDYVREFVSYFEDGRAENLKEARILFDTFLHHKKMEQANAQLLSSIQAGNAAIIAAANRATDAANAAASATRSLDQTANYIRSK